MVSRTMLVTVTALAATGLGIAQPALAAASPQEGPHGHHHLHATRMSTTEAAVNLVPPHIAGLHAVLTDADTNEALQGKLVVFTNTAGRELCRAVTDPYGDAGCSAPLAPSASTLDTALSGYDASFPGDRHYKPISSHGTITLDVDDLAKQEAR